MNDTNIPAPKRDGFTIEEKDKKRAEQEARSKEFRKGGARHDPFTGGGAGVNVEVDRTRG